MARVRTLREFDDVITATYCGFTDASDYYARSSALRIAAKLRANSPGGRSGRSVRSVCELSDPALAKNPQHPV